MTSLDRFNEEPETVALLDNITELYSIDVGGLYLAQAQKQQQQTSPGGPQRRGGKAGGKTGGAPPGASIRFDYRQFAHKVFDDIPSNKLGSIYISLLEIAEAYMNSVGKSMFGANQFPQSMLHLKILLINLIVPYQLPSAQTSKISSETNDPLAPKPSPKDKKRRGMKTVMVSPRGRLKDKEVERIFELFLPIVLPFESKLWKQIKYILVPDNNDAKLAKLAPIVANSTKEGHICFNSLTFCMTDVHLKKNLPASAITMALYLGPLKATTVEVFASGQKEAFRAQCRDVLQAAQLLTTDQTLFSQSQPECLWNHQELIQWKHFIYNTNTLLGHLRGEVHGDININPSWACAAIKKFGKKTYKDKTWKEENLYDLIWTILTQRPYLKKFITDTLEKDFHDYGAARYWKLMQPVRMSRTMIQNRNIEEVHPLFRADDTYLHFPPVVKDVSFVRTATHLDLIIGIVKSDIPAGGAAVVGLDAEWSAFTGISKATILQLATLEHVFVIDLESKDISTSKLRQFLSALFLDKNIIKLGFQFSEDLYQLRAAVNQCHGLYEPEKVLCIGRLICDLLEATERRPDCNEILDEVVPNFRAAAMESNNGDDSIVEGKDDADGLNDSAIMESGAEEESSAVAESTSPVKPAGGHKNGNPVPAAHRTLNKGLSAVCELVLGKPLDKMEQCSVWDRRPLRPLQLRYAAMDAYCLLLLFDVAKKWAERLDCSIEDFCAKQGPIRVSLPLLSEADFFMQ